MGIRRRRRRLTTLMSRMEQRVRSVELRPINLLTSGEIASVVTIGDPAVGPETIVSATAPYQFKKVQDGYVYPKALTGLSADRVELYTEADTGAAVGERVEVSGIHWAGSSQIDVTGDNFTVTNIDEPNWSGRPSYKHDPTTDQLAGVTISHAYEFAPESAAPQTWTTRKRLQTRRKVDSFEITAAPNSTVTLTMNADHHFEVGDIVFVDIFSESSQAYGVDGLFEISGVTSNTIDYVLTAGVDTPVTNTDVSSADVYVFPVIREWAQDGSIWVDSANNETYYWNGIRWVEYTPGAVAGDGDPPSPPTSLSATSEINFPTGSVARVQVSLSWTAPTTSVSGNPITDLAGYLIKWRPGSSGDWKTYSLDDATATSFSFDEVGTFATGTTYNFEVYAKDSGGEISTSATASTTTPTTPATNITAIRPADFTNDPPYLGTVTLYWDGTVENSSGVTQSNPSGLYYLEIHKSTSATFTASSSTLIGTINAVPGAKFVDGSLSSAYGSTFYYRAILVDGNGTSSLQSDPPLSVTASSNVDVSVIQGIIDAANITPGTIVTGEDIIGINVTGDLIRGNTIRGNLIEANSITADQIDVGNLTAQIISSGSFTTRASGTSSGFTIDSTGIYGYNGSSPTFSISASTGAVVIGGYATNSNVSAVSTVATTANNTANSAQSTATTANSTANTAISDVQAVQNNVYFPGTTQINGGSIRTGTIVADALGGATMTDFLIAGNDIATSSTNPRVKMNNAGFFMFNSSASPIVRMYTANAATFFEGPVTTGGLLRTKSSGTRIEIESDTYNAIRFIYNSSATNMTNTSSGTFLGGDFRVGGLVASGQGDRMVGSNQFTGLLYRSSTSSSTSDLRLKKDVSDLDIGINFIDKLRPVSFSWKADSENKTHHGLVAQEVESTLEDLDLPKNVYLDVDENRTVDGKPAMAVNHKNLVWPLIQSVKDLKKEIEELKAEVEYLKNSKETP